MSIGLRSQRSEVRTLYRAKSQKHARKVGVAQRMPKSGGVSHRDCERCSFYGRTCPPHQISDLKKQVRELKAQLRGLRRG